MIDVVRSLASAYRDRIINFGIRATSVRAGRGSIQLGLGIVIY